MSDLLTAERTFPSLDAQEMRLIRGMADVVDLEDGQYALRAGQGDAPFCVVETGRLVVRNPADGDAEVAYHGPGHFAGDIDLLTRRPILADIVAQGPTRILRVDNTCLRRLLNTVPRLSEKLLDAFQSRRQMLEVRGPVGLKVVGDKRCGETNRLREFLHKNFVPFSWYDMECEAGRAVLRAAKSTGHGPVVECGEGRYLIRPSLAELAQCAGIWRGCPVKEIDLAVVGCGPAGMATAVYAASEGLSTLVLDRLGPGGQAGGSSRIENFIGFPSGLSGSELAERGVLQMLKFGAQLVAPVDVTHLDPAPAPGEYHTIHLDCGAAVRARVVLIATGATWKRLPAKNADDFERRGIHYACTAVESLLYEGQPMAVVGAGNSSGQAAMFLAETCAKHVHLIVRGTSLAKSMSQYLAARIEAHERITVHYDTVISEVIGGAEIDAVCLRRSAAEPESDAAAPESDAAAPESDAAAPGADDPATPARPDERLAVKAIFVFIGAEPHTPWLPDCIARDAKGYLLTGAESAATGKWPCPDRPPCPLETTIPGVLAAGDVRSGSTKRVGFAVGDGSLAVTCVHQLLQQA